MNAWGKMLDDPFEGVRLGLPAAAFSILGMDFVMADRHLNVFQRPTLAACIHADGHHGARTQSAEALVVFEESVTDLPALDDTTTEMLHNEFRVVAEGTAGLRIQRISYLDSGRVAELTKSIYRGDAYDFVAELRLST